MDSDNRAPHFGHLCVAVSFVFFGKKSAMSHPIISAIFSRDFTVGFPFRIEYKAVRLTPNLSARSAFEIPLSFISVSILIIIVNVYCGKSKNKNQNKQIENLQKKYYTITLYI